MTAPTYPADPTCRFAREAVLRPDVVRHTCSTRDGAPLRDGQACWAESRSALLSQQDEREQFDHDGPLEDEFRALLSGGAS